MVSSFYIISSIVFSTKSIDLDINSDNDVDINFVDF